jgi:hypothetical protein
MSKLSKIFIIHYTKLTERKEHMLDQLQKWFPDVDYEFVEEFDQEDLTPEIIQENFDLDSFEKQFDRKMLKAEMSLCMKYKKAVNDIAKAKKGEQFFILEDDVIFKEDPIQYIIKMDKLCDEYKLAYDCVFLGEAWIRKGDDRDIFGVKPYPSTNGLCTVLYKKNSLKKLHIYLQQNKITQPMDWELNDRFRDLNFQVYWGKAITKHGSVLAKEDDNFECLKSSLRDDY